MKNHRFPWLRNRTTDNRKCEKARNIKEKRTIEMLSAGLWRLLYPFVLKEYIVQQETP